MTPSNLNTNKFIPFSVNISDYALPSSFTFPYYYTPHPLATIAMDELQAYLEKQTEWPHDFNQMGKMFAVLVVKNSQGDIGYLASFCDEPNQSTQEKHPEFFVDAIANPCQTDDLNDEVTSLGTEITQHKNASGYLQLQHTVRQKHLESEQKIADLQQRNAKAKATRKQARRDMESKLGVSINEAQLQDFISDLGAQSSREKRVLKALKQQWQVELMTLNDALKAEQSVIDDMERQWAKLNGQLTIESQKSCLFLNQAGVEKSLYDLFNYQSQSQSQDQEQRPISGSVLATSSASNTNSTPVISSTHVMNSTPIANSSEQNLPKLLQAAFSQQLTPIALGEFWWGASPYAQIRQHKNLYPVCQSKCFEILEHILEGISTDPSPLEQTPSHNKALDIVYEDDTLVVVNKPAEFLSVSGKYISDSVQARMQARYPNATGPMIVHRLDMSTSGLLVLTLTAEANKHVQKQFIERSVEKRYTALLEGVIQQQSGVITLPMCGDLTDRPRQMVCHEQGRGAETTYQVVSTKNHRTKIHLFPKTGRTHQLRVHCAHQAGLNTPIVGDDLYGFKDSRLHLHAGYLKFVHPVSRDTLEFEVAADF
ncbi:pseudouridine synthase [Vibrio sp. 10N.261.51.F12]|uniref:pseudouridine synthase n=1 Tax=Vibrio sp. 10N.261.51.F12 TaxID=3229679 RepID=UPI0035538A2D